MHHKFYFLLLPYTRLELPGWGSLLGLLKIKSFHNKDARFRSLPKKIIRGKLHGYKMELDLSDWNQRMTYFLGRYYEAEVQELLALLLEKGDRFVDIGANIGMLTLTAARLVGKRGEIDCIEPNPNCTAAITKNINLNGINNVKIYQFGLSDANGKMRLNLSSSHTGTATLAAIPNIESSYEVDVITGDEILLSNKKLIKLIKIDVEGYELHALKGLKNTIKTNCPFLITEFVESHFRRAGTSGKEIESFLRKLGYNPYYISGKRNIVGSRLQLIPMLAAPDNNSKNDLLWIHNSHQLSEKIRRHITDAG